MKHTGATRYCVLCGKPIFSGQEVDQVPLDVPPYRLITGHEDCCKAHNENWFKPIELPIHIEE